MLGKDEMETIVRYDRSSKICNIYTANPTEIKKFDKIYKCVKEYKCDGEIYAKSYETDKGLISFRTGRKKLSEEHKAKLIAGRGK